MHKWGTRQVCVCTDPSAQRRTFRCGYVCPHRSTAGSYLRKCTCNMQIYTHACGVSPVCMWFRCLCVWMCCVTLVYGGHEVTGLRTLCCCAVVSTPPWLAGGRVRVSLAHLGLRLQEKLRGGFLRSHITVRLGTKIWDKLWLIIHSGAILCQNLVTPGPIGVPLLDATHILS